MGVNIIKCPTNIASGTLGNGVYGTTRNINSYNATTDSVVTATFNNGFGNSSGFAVGVDVSVLPVKYLSFTANKKVDYVQLNWSTATEINNKWFEIERSTDLNNFEKIGTVNGAGNSNTIKNYLFNDKTMNNIREHYIYYRLKQVDFNGNYEYSNIRVIETNAENDEFIIFPQPAHNQLFVKYAHNEQFRFEIIDANGRALIKGSNYGTQAELDISNLISGMYYLNITNNEGESKVFKFIKL